MTNEQNKLSDERLREEGVEVLRRLSVAKLSLSDASFIAGWVTEARNALSRRASAGGEAVAWQEIADPQVITTNLAYVKAAGSAYFRPLYAAPAPSSAPVSEVVYEVCQTCFGTGLEAPNSYCRYCDDAPALHSKALPDVSEAAVILGAQRIFEIFCGKSVNWSDHSMDEEGEGILHSADWQQAMAYSRAALNAAQGGK